MQDENKRRIEIKIRVNEKEREFISEGMKSAEYVSRERFIRKMVFDGAIFRIDMTEVRELLRLIANATGNINQIVKVANQTRSIYETDVIALKCEHAEIKSDVDSIAKIYNKINTNLNKISRV
ncbi:MAG: plasmid mobilization relaxosome protein MobC [Defluviitaleaceae bacterium]|nr:plasmid mobilization relaxosome protein MobC [Defluviitaleaceae bacterium]